MQDAETMPPLFIVILDEILVARDIEMIICDLRPDAQVVVARKLADAEARIPEGRVEAAFVQSDAASFLASEIGRRVTGDGGQVVLVGQEPDVVADGVAVLAIPFAHEDVAVLLVGMTQI